MKTNYNDIAIKFELAIKTTKDKSNANKLKRKFELFDNIIMGIDNYDEMSFDVRTTKNGLYNIGELIEIATRKIVKSIKKNEMRTSRLRGYDFALNGEGLEIKVALLDKSTPYNSNCTALVVSYDGAYIIPKGILQKGERLKSTDMRNYKEFYNQDISEILGL